MSLKISKSFIETNILQNRFGGILSLNAQVLSNLLSGDKIYSYKKGLDRPNKIRHAKSKKIRFKLTTVPQCVNLATSSFYPKVYDQLQLGSCTANGVAFCFQYDILKINPQDTFFPSRLFIYFCERLLDYVQYNPYSNPPNTSYPSLESFTNNQILTSFTQQDSDTGSNDFQGIDVLKLYGVCNESYWPYSDNSTDFITLPISNWTNIVNDSNNHKAKTFYSVGGLTQQYDSNPSYFFENVLNDLSSIKTALSLGYPIVFGILIPLDTDKELNQYPSSSTFFTCPSTSSTPKPIIIDIPASYQNTQDYINNSNNFAGGHCIVIVGYDDTLQAFLIRNSWGTSWGINGHFYLSYNFVSNPNLSNDFWVLSDINDANITLDE